MLILTFAFLVILALGVLVVLAFSFFLIPLASPAILAEEFSNRRATIRKLKRKHRWANEVTKKTPDIIKQWQDFSEINSGMDPYRYQVEWTRGTKPGTEQLQGDETLTTLLQRKEVPFAFEANFMQESQQNPSTVSHPSDPSSSSIPARTNSYLSSSTNGTSFDRSKEEPKTGKIQAY
ncbi:hypothetical protein MRB53_024519 [Persea americana]|uniref:Uncharacterized protein n=1 Tax=Persea americana TaxID=3435 RepID=A0ACC2LCK3_PERAE|nr:hypothetical protein MRB53_024519 [Persea americana]